MTKNTLIYDILGILSGGAGNTVDDSGITPRQIGFWIDSTRAMLIDRDLAKNKPIPPVLLNHICLDLELRDSSECPECALSGCYLYRSTRQIPTNLFISRVGSTIYSKSGYNKSDFQRFPWITTQYNQTWYAIKDNYVYLKTKSFTNCVLVSLIAEFPDQLVDYLDADQQPCYSEDMDYPVELHTIEELKAIILKNNGLILQTQADQENDSADIKQKAS